MRRPKPASAKRPLSWIRERLRDLRYLAADVLYVAGRFARRASRAASASWEGLSVAARRRLAAALGAAAVLLVAVGVAVPSLPCGFPGGDSCPPADDAEHLVPADALAYLHLDLDPDADQYRQAARIAGDLPLISGQVIDRALAQVPGPNGGRVDFDRDLRPWFGGETALAVLGDGRSAQRVDLLEVSDERAAAEFADSIGGPSARLEDYEGVEVTVDSRGIATAQVEGFLAVGTRDGVRAIVDAATGANGATALADDRTAAEVRDQLPDERLADVYLTADGVRRLIHGSAALDSIAPLLAPHATRGAAAALVATDEGLELAVRSALDPERVASAPGFFAAFPRFEPTLAGRLGPDTLGYVGIGEPRTAVAALSERVSAPVSGIAAGLSDLVDGLRRAAELEIADDLLAALGDEGALALRPRAGRAPAPYLEFVAGRVDEEEARRALGALSTRSKRRELDGVEARSVRLPSVGDVTYAAFDGIAAVAGDPDGIEALAAGDGGLDESDLYARATADLGGEASLVAYVDIGGLVGLGERLGLGEDPVYATFAGELRRLEALAARVDATDGLLATDARLLVAERAAGAAAAPPSD